jgi:adenosylcobinamide-GDP ribazoletransferase
MSERPPEGSATVADGVRFAFGTLTVLPVSVGRWDRAAGRGGMLCAPAVGLVVGLLAGAAGAAVVWLGGPPALAGVAAVAVPAVLTRGLHLDGLADTADGLGCYGPPERALAVMRDGAAGPFAVVTLVVVVGTQAVSLAALSARGPAVLALAALAAATGRAAFAWVSRRGVAAARPGGLGATVAGSQPWWVAAGWWLVLAGAGFGLAGPRGVLGVALAAAVTALLARHTARRFGGMTGDVLGAASELASTAALIVLAAG